MEINITKDLEKNLQWEQPTQEKNWEQAHLKIDNIDADFIQRFSFLIPSLQKDNDFKVGEFIKFN